MSKPKRTVQMARSITSEQVKRFVDTHIESILGGPEVAQALHVSYETLRKRFRCITGKTLHQYITSVRIEKTKELLEAADLRCINISLKVGFRREDVASKVFKRKTGMTMTTYRNRHLARKGNQNRHPKKATRIGTQKRQPEMAGPMS